MGNSNENSTVIRKKINKCFRNNSFAESKRVCTSKIVFLTHGISQRKHSVEKPASIVFFECQTYSECARGMHSAIMKQQKSMTVRLPNSWYIVVDVNGLKSSMHLSFVVVGFMCFEFINMLRHLFIAQRINVFIPGYISIPIVIGLIQGFVTRFFQYLFGELIFRRFTVFTRYKVSDIVR